MSVEETRSDPWIVLEPVQGSAELENPIFECEKGFAVEQLRTPFKMVSAKTALDTHGVPTFSIFAALRTFKAFS